MKKVLFTAKVDQHIINFHLPYLKYFKELGYEVHVASHGNKTIPYVDKKIELPLIQSPKDIKQMMRTYAIIKDLTKSFDYTLVHCHTPIIGVITRLVMIHERNEATKVVYTAHGFHFYQGAPLSHWLIYFPVEKYLASHTDVLITINEVDYHNALRYRFKAKKIKLVHGVGIDLTQYAPELFESQAEIRARHHYKTNDFILIYVAELNKNKNQTLLIEMVDVVKREIPDIKLLLVGDGPHEAYYQEMVADRNLDEQIKFLGFREDVAELLKLADVSVSASNREGLPLNILEGMAMKNPLVVTNVRGNRDLVTNKKNGFVVNDLNEFIVAVLTLYHFPNQRAAFGEQSRQDVESYSLDVILEEMKIIYQEVLNSDTLKYDQTKVKML